MDVPKISERRRWLLGLCATVLAVALLAVAAAFAGTANKSSATAPQANAKGGYGEVYKADPKVLAHTLFNAKLLPHNTMARNIAFGVADAEISLERVRAVIRMVQLEQLVATLPAGLDTVVGERGVRFRAASHGEGRQQQSGFRSDGNVYGPGTDRSERDIRWRSEHGGYEREWCGDFGGLHCE